MHLVKYKVGLIVGVLAAFCHLVWSVFVVTGAAQPIIDWILKMHFLNNPFLIQPFDWLTAAMLVVFTFVVGFVFGWVLAFLCNWLCKK